MCDLQQTKIYSSEQEIQGYQQMVRLLKTFPVSNSEILSNIIMFLTRSTFSHIMFMKEMYERIINVPGCIMEFGVRWGRNLALFEVLRCYYEPFNYSRKIIGFDTFEGFPQISCQDGMAESVKVGNLKVTEDYVSYLNQLLEIHENLAPRSNIKKFSLIKGNALETLPKYLKDNPETVISFAYFDFDLYEPTKKCLNLIKSHLTKGSVVGFDEFYLREFPGETIAVKETFGFNNIKLLSSPSVPHAAYFVIE